MAVTGAFLTGRPVRVRIGEYPKLQLDLGRQLEQFTGQGWSINDDHWRQDGTYYSGGGFTSMLPLVLARREGPAILEPVQAALHDQRDTQHAWFAKQSHAWDLSLRALRIDIYDLGMAVLNATVEVRTPVGVRLESAARTLKRLTWLKPDPDVGIEPPVATALRAVAHQTTHQFATAIHAGAPHAAQPAWLSPFVEGVQIDNQTRQATPDEWGRLLWLHPVHLLHASDTDAMAACAAEVAPPFHRFINIPDGLYVPGIDWSAIVTNNGLTSTQVPMRLIELHWAYIALYMEIDRGLLALLDNDRWYKPESLTALEHDADRVFGDYMRVMEARARLDSALASLGGDEFAIWEAIAGVTKFDALIDGVDRKVDALQRVAERRVQQAAATRARRTSTILSSLTALTFVTVAIALIDYILGGRSDTLGHLGLRVGLVLTALAASIGLYLEAFRERNRSQTRNPDHRHDSPHRHPTSTPNDLPVRRDTSCR